MTAPIATAPVPIQLTFRGLDASAAVSDYVTDKALKLQASCEGITSFRIAVESLNHHHQKGTPYRVRIDLHIRGRELVAGDHASKDASHADVYVAIDDAFVQAKREIHDFVERRRDEARDAPEGSVPRGRQ